MGKEAGKTAILKKVQTLPIGLKAAWDFFSDPRNLPAITPPAMGFRVLSEPPPGIHAGLILRYSVRPLPLYRTTWISEITEVREPEWFVDEQRSGPYRMWRHEHAFRATPVGTIVQDTIRYRLPFGIAGDLVAGAFVRRALDNLFAYRADALRRRFGTV